MTWSKAITRVGFVMMFLLVLVLLPKGAKASGSIPKFDSGASIDSSNPYTSTQEIKDIFTDQAIYGKISVKLPVDIYSFTSDRDGDQGFSLLTNRMDLGLDQTTSPYLIVMDPTKNNESKDLGIPTPNGNYQSVVVKFSDIGAYLNEPLMLQSYSKISEQQIKLAKGQKYYILVYDPSQKINDYVLKIGNSKQLWDAKTLVGNFGVWWKIKTDSYAGASAFSFNGRTAGMLMFFLFFSAMLGLIIINEIFAWGANRSKALAFLLVKYQSYYKISLWISLWFTALGGYIYLSQFNLIGISFILVLLFVPMIINILYQTLKLSPAIAQLQVKGKESVIPVQLRKRLFVTSLIHYLVFGAFITFLAMYFA